MNVRGCVDARKKTQDALRRQLYACRGPSPKKLKLPKLLKIIPRVSVLENSEKWGFPWTSFMAYTTVTIKLTDIGESPGKRKAAVVERCVGSEDNEDG